MSETQMNRKTKKDRNWGRTERKRRTGRHREPKTERERDRQTDRQIDRQTDR